MKRTSLLTTLATAFVASPSWGALLVGTTGESEFSASFQQNQYLAQEFALPAEAALDSVQLTFVENEGLAFDGLFQVVDRIGVDATAANVLLSQSITLPSGSGPSHVSLPTPITLAAGNYFLLVSTTAPLPLQTRWVFPASESDAPGTVGAAFFSVSQNELLPAASPFLEITGGPTSFLAFRIEGTMVPEPQSLLVAIGVLASLALFDRRMFLG
jgi:hypothetical protein